VATLSSGFICWIVLLHTCLPLNRIRCILLVVVAAAFVLACLTLGNIFLLIPLTGPALMLLAGLAVLGTLLILLFRLLLRPAPRE